MLAEPGAPEDPRTVDRSAARLFLVADDLTGALDAATRFASPTAPVTVRWRVGGPPTRGHLALDAGTREVDADTARAMVAALVATAPRDPSTLFYAKLDSLLRGNAAAEIAAWIDGLRPSACLIAPAFPIRVG